MINILVADDEPDIHTLVKRYAERENYIVTTVSDGTEAVELCKKNDYDIIIMDIMMPEMDGFKACKEIKKLKDIPIIMLSARGEEYDKLFGFEVGADDYVVKPFSPKELMARVSVIVKRNRIKQKILLLKELKLTYLDEMYMLMIKKLNLQQKNMIYFYIL